KQPLTAQQILQDKDFNNANPNQKEGRFCYYFDVRGGIDGFKGKLPGKTCFNFGFEHCLTNIQNLAVIGRSAGYTDIAPALGRILELNVSIAEQLAKSFVD
ncbi:MAG TPA: hypothetical protein V6C96_05080, partial [Vampirovibrionales bacterium]